MDAIKELLEGYRRFYNRYFVTGSDHLYSSLANGQRPSTLFIGCSDSRVDPAILTDANPGDIFVVRNVANLVPQYQPEWSTCHGISAAIEFAVCVLNVRNIIVMGHTNCGGVRSLLDREHSKKESFIDTWLNIASCVKREVSHIREGGKCKYSVAEEFVIKLSLENLLTFPYIKSRVKSGETKLHGWYFSIKTGKLRIYDEFKKTFHPIVL